MDWRVLICERRSVQSAGGPVEVVRCRVRRLRTFGGAKSVCGGVVVVVLRC